MNKLNEKLAGLKNTALEKLLQVKSFLYFLGCGLWHFCNAVTGKVKTKRIKELLAFISVVAFFLVSAAILRLLDPTAATYDLGVLQIIILSLVMYAAFLWVTWSSFKVIWPDLGEFMKHYFKDTFNQLAPWEKIRLSVFIYCFHLLMLVLLSRVIH